MQLLEHNHTHQQPVSTTNTQDDNSSKNQPKLTMIWVEEYHEGRQRLIAKWIAL